MDEIAARTMKDALAARRLLVAWVGVSTGLLDALRDRGPLSTEELAAQTSLDAAYVLRWAEAAYAFALLDEGWTLTEEGARFAPSHPRSLFGAAFGVAQTAHMAHLVLENIATGVRPGETALSAPAELGPWFAPMMERGFGGLFERTVLPGVPVFAEVGARGGTVVDLGCGNGWYLRALLRHFPGLRGLGLEHGTIRVQQARQRAEAEGLAERLRFEEGDLSSLQGHEPVDLIAMNRALHHTWDRRDEVFALLASHLRPDGAVVIWEPRWPAERATLREPGMAPMAMQNLSEHVQGNHFLRQDQVEGAMVRAGLRPQTWLFEGGKQMVVVGRRG